MTEIDVWRYHEREAIPFVSLYLAQNGLRYRSLREKNLTTPVPSTAASIEAIIQELETTRAPGGRSMEHDSEDAFERLRSAGYIEIPGDEGAPLNIVSVGHVDHGKSTLIGRLLYETGSLPDGTFAELVASSERRGVEMEWSFALDALQAERDQAITIDTTRIWFRTGGRRYAIIDAPGHRQFISNMMSGASEADAAILMLDVSQGVSEQTRRHAYLLKLLGIEQLVVAVNKMDAVDFDKERFATLAREIEHDLLTVGLRPMAVVPVSARHGDNLVHTSARLPWYTGPTLVELLERFDPAAQPEAEALRMRVQDVYRNGTERIAVGRIEAGMLQVGDEIVISPDSSTARVSTIARWPSLGEPIARKGESVGITVDRPIFIDRGDVISHVDDVPDRSRAFSATLFWMAERGPELEATYRIQFGPTEARVSIDAIERIVDTERLEPLAQAALPQHALYDLSLRSRALLPLDERDRHSSQARCVLLRGRDVVACGFISRVQHSTSKATNLTPHEHLVRPSERHERNGHPGAVIWLTGLSGSGKSTIAMAVERRLFARGKCAYVLDGDNVRCGLNRDLGFSPVDRTENIRRVAHVAALFADAGAIVITAFISPSSEDRATARAATPEHFYEVYLSADLATCELRDPHGLYARARAGEIAEFTGISAPYDAPLHADLVIDTATDLDECVEGLVEFIERECALPVGAAR